MKSVPEGLQIGVDEAGRGSLAGPVYAGAVVFNPENFKRKYSAKIRDSKLLSEEVREEMFSWLEAHHRIGIGFATVEEIERLNILNASLLAMKRAFESLPLSIEELGGCHVFVDGNHPIKNFRYPQTTIIGGDNSMKCISAASIVAKVARDREMKRLDEIYQGYGFKRHKGYATDAHCEAIRKLGPCQIHRKTFFPIREHFELQ